VKLKRASDRFASGDDHGLPGGVTPFVLLGVLGLAMSAWVTGARRIAQGRRRF
jgi:hypothetical protein